MSETFNCCVAIGGDIRSVVSKADVSIAEILLLQHIHGPDAVHLIRPSGSSDKGNDQMRDELGREYGDDKIVELFNQFGELPQTLREARVGDELMDPVYLHERNNKPVKRRATKPKAKPKAKVVAEVEEG